MLTHMTERKTLRMGGEGVLVEIVVTPLSKSLSSLSGNRITKSLKRRVTLVDPRMWVCKIKTTRSLPLRIFEGITKVARGFEPLVSQGSLVVKRQDNGNCGLYLEERCHTDQTSY